MTVYRGEDLRIEERAIGGGETIVTFRHYVDKEQLHGKGRLFANITVPVGGAVGFHQHVDESEFYVIQAGRGRYRMDDESWEVMPGDVTEVAPGHSHGIENIGVEPLEFTALIVFA